MSEEPEFFVVLDLEGSRHYGQGVLAIVKTEQEANALKAAMDGRWDGCEGNYNIKIKKIKFGLEKFYKYYFFCKHDWQEHKELFICSKCDQRFNKARLEKEKLPAFDGIAYYDETLKQLVFPKETIK